MSNTLGREWAAVTLFGEAPVDMLYATDGYVYIATASKIYKTDLNFETFTELTLSGSVNTAFGGLAELPNGSVIANDRNNYWLKPRGSNTITRNAGADLTYSFSYWSKGNQVTAYPGMTESFRHSTISYGKGAGLHGGPGNAVYVEGTTFTASEANLAGWCYEKGVVYNDAQLVVCSGGSERHSITVFPLDSTIRVYAYETGPNDPGIYSNHQGSIALEPGTNRLWVVGLKSQTEWFYHYSDDGGETWTDRTAVTFSGLNNFGGGDIKLRIPFEGHFLISHGGKAYLTEDYFASIEEIDDLDGGQCTQLYTFSPSEGTTIALLGTDGSSVSNLYYSIQEPDVEDEPYVEPKLLIRWRDEGKPNWSNYREISLGNSGQTEIIKKLRGLGRYRTRQYELVCTSKFPMTIALIEEFVKLGQGGDGSGS